jgi:hypothetical protein
MTCGYYRTSSPVTALPIIMRWISLVPSKIVKFLAVVTCDQHACSRSSSSPGDEPVIDDGHLPLLSKL